MLNRSTECNWGDRDRACRRDRAIARLMQRNGSTMNDISVQSDALSGDRAALSARLGTGSPARSTKKDFFLFLMGENLAGFGTGSPASSTKKCFF